MDVVSLKCHDGSFPYSKQLLIKSPLFEAWLSTTDLKELNVGIWSTKVLQNSLAYVTLDMGTSLPDDPEVQKCIEWMEGNAIVASKEVLTTSSPPDRVVSSREQATNTMFRLSLPTIEGEIKETRTTLRFYGSPLVDPSHFGFLKNDTSSYLQFNINRVVDFIEGGELRVTFDCATPIPIPQLLRSINLAMTQGETSLLNRVGDSNEVYNSLFLKPSFGFSRLSTDYLFDGKRITYRIPLAVAGIPVAPCCFCPTTFALEYDTALPDPTFELKLSASVVGTKRINEIFSKRRVFELPQTQTWVKTLRKDDTHVNIMLDDVKRGHLSYIFFWFDGEAGDEAEQPDVVWARVVLRGCEILCCHASEMLEDAWGDYKPPRHNRVYAIRMFEMPDASDALSLSHIVQELFLEVSTKPVKTQSSIKVLGITEHNTIVCENGVTRRHFL